jgi:aryl-alcohol dehydrogenase-like predicted oxidoreductase
VNLLLPGTDVRLPPLAYGCAALMARASRSESVRLLEEALDVGITHFDVARSYGYGEAESAVGDVLARQTGKVTVATKLGIAPPERTTALRAAKALARRLASASPRLRESLRAAAGRMTTTGRFSTAEARRSLEQSLRELRTRPVDLLLLHDCRLVDLHDDLLAYLRERVAAGDIRAFGVATSRRDAAEIMRSRPEFAPVVQIPDSLLLEPLDGLEPVITHSALAPVRALLSDRLRQDDRSSSWSAAVGADVRDPAVLARLLLGAALRRNPGGTVLASSRNPDHIRENARVVREPPPSEQLDVFERLVAQDVPLLPRG